MKRGKAPGPDGIVPALLKAGGQVMARHLCSLFHKVALWASEPLQWKTGILTALFKKGDHKDPANYRSIYISDHVAKIFHGCFRDHLNDLYEMQAEDTQMGGRKGKGTDMAHHILQAFQAKAQVDGVCSAIFFLDLHSAFYAVLRQFLFSEGWSDQVLCRLLQYLKIDPDQIDELRRQSQKYDATKHFHSHGVAILRDIFNGANFQMRGVNRIGIPQRGTRPGDPVGDVCFNLLMSGMLRDYRVRMACNGWTWLGETVDETSHNLYDSCKFPEEPVFYDVSFVDDVSVMMTCQDGGNLLPMAGEVAQCWCQVARTRGLQVNFKAEKSEVLITFRGRGSRQMKQDLFLNGPSELVVEDDGQKQALQIVHSYKHLGTHFQVDGRSQKDGQYRVTKAKQAWGPLARPFFSKRAVAVPTKVTIFSSLVMSRLVYQVHTWAWAKDTTVEQWHNAVRPMLYSMAKQMVGPACLESLDTTTICGLLHMLSPKDTVTRNRLLYLARALKHAPRSLWFLIAGVEHEDGWTTKVRHDLQWLLDFHGWRNDMPDTLDVWEWLQYIGSTPEWPSIVRKAVGACKRFRNNAANGKLWERRMAHGFQQDGVKVGAQVQHQSNLQCNICQKTFTSRRALAMHAHQVHGYVPLTKCFAFGNECWICRRLYHNRPRLIHHLAYSSRCLDRLQSTFPALSKDKLEEMEAEDLEQANVAKQSGWNRHKALVPVVSIPMPALPPVGSMEAIQLRAKWQTRFGEGVEAFRQLDGIRIDDGEVPHDNDYPSFILESYGGNEHGDGGKFSCKGMSVWDCQLHLRCVCFVHFYSGYRRHGDLCHCIERDFMWGTTQIFCLSVDLCLQGEKGDLTKAENQKWWLARVASRQVFGGGGGGGSPCETYSAARYMDNGPPPLRSASHPYGLPHLGKRQARQVSVGSSLLYFLTLFLRVVAAAGGCGFSEHPQYPTWLRARDPPSIWQLPPMSWFKKLACASFLSFDQCCVGGVAIKPTTLLLIRMGQTRAYIRERGAAGRCNHGKGAHRSLCGQEGGVFSTARAKVYPEGLNKAIAAGVYGFLANSLGIENLPNSGCPDIFDSFCPDVEPEEVRIQPDYYGG